MKISFVDPTPKVRYGMEWDDGISFGEEFTTKEEAVKAAKVVAEKGGHRYGRDVHVLRIQRISAERKR